MTRTALRDRKLPSYSKGEERFHMISHIVGGALGIFALVSCVVLSALNRDVWAVVGSSVYGVSLIALYTMSSIYHGLRHPTAKKVFQVLDHCTIYFLIAGTYTPIVLGPIRRYSAGWGWALFGLVWGLAVMATVFTAIDLKKYAKFSMTCYIGMGWCIVLAIKPAMAALSLAAMLWILAGGIAYTIGAILYGIGKRRRYIHGVFHVFVLLGSVLQFIGIFWHVI